VLVNVLLQENLRSLKEESVMLSFKCGEESLLEEEIDDGLHVRSQDTPHGMTISRVP